MGYCDKCKGYNLGDCYCVARKIINEDGDEYVIHGKTIYHAAIQYAKKINLERDYYLIDNEVKITVDGRPFVIGAEYDINYSVNEELKEQNNEVS